jgi:hypothetical protein
MRQFAIIRERGVTFVIVVVKAYVIQSTIQAQNVRAALEREYGCSVVLWGDDNRYRYGDPNLVNYLRNVTADRIPWRRAA